MLKLLKRAWGAFFDYIVGGCPECDGKNLCDSCIKDWAIR